tara:strand:+ start:481 stop:840 length:360 start_codon:yes stop_codon:yes gene_type:complete
MSQEYPRSNMDQLLMSRFDHQDEKLQRPPVGNPRGVLANSLGQRSVMDNLMIKEYKPSKINPFVPPGPQGKCINQQGYQPSRSTRDKIDKLIYKQMPGLQRPPSLIDENMGVEKYNRYM